jgi:hypothetical protein
MELWSWLLSAIGISGMVAIGYKKWWSFSILIVAECLWIAYSLSTKQYGFIMGATAYITVHAINMRRWRGESRTH